MIGGGAAGALLLVGLAVAITLMLHGSGSRESNSKQEGPVAQSVADPIRQARRQSPVSPPIEAPTTTDDEVRPFRPSGPESSSPPVKARDNASTPSLRSPSADAGPSPKAAESKDAKPKEPSSKAAEPKEPSPKSPERTESKPQAPPSSVGADNSGSIPTELLEHLKSATVFVRVDGTEFRASGSGFLVHVQGETAYVVTNAHVIDPKIEIELPRQGGPPGMQRFGPPSGRGFPMGPMGPRFMGPQQGDQETQKIIIPMGNATITPVFWSGTKKEQSYTAKVVASDPKRDLAILKLTGCKDLGKPIDISRAPTLQETMPIYVLGFPFGSSFSTNRRNPTITVGKGSVSNIRRDERDQVAMVQIDGALNPGNSGGPVVDSEGRLVGVAVATINPEVGSGIGFAIPASKLTPLLPGKTDDSPPEKLFTKAPRIYLSDLDEYNVKSGLWPFTNNGKLGDPDDHIILINGYKSPKGISMHPPKLDYATASYRLRKQAALFRAEVGLNDSSTPLSAAVFEVWGDGKRLWKSKAIDQLIYSQRCRVDVSKVDVLELRVSSTGSAYGLHAIWYEPRLLEKPNTPDK
jgi:S1-C subfamily serine protease